MKVLDVELALTVSEGSIEGNWHQCKRRRSSEMIWQNGPVCSAGGWGCLQIKGNGGKR